MVSARVSTGASRVSVDGGDSGPVQGVRHQKDRIKLRERLREASIFERKDVGVNLAAQRYGAGKAPRFSPLINEKTDDGPKQ